MSQQWRVRIGEKISKPLSSEEVKRYYKAGKISQDAMLSQDGLTWSTMEEIVRRSAATSGSPATSVYPLDQKANKEKVKVSLRCSCGWEKQVEVAKTSYGKQVVRSANQRSRYWHKKTINQKRNCPKIRFVRTNT